MGRTRFSGPVYGAKQTLWSANALTLSTGVGSTLVAATIVPVGEDWYATEFQAFRGSTASSQAGFSIQKGSSVLSSITFTSTTANVANSINVITPTGGEKEGARIPSGSTVTFHYADASSQSALTRCSWMLSGYRRFVTSSRSE
jgi:hypothetical protein